ncbi:hypothetical protein PR202_ga24031 [Eleusine coracana subsp. coracana]|uniref:VWFA domain-containing protein n=1 Tax=Eleusine coracana subsp. coracana TaxID=191504 RepID=A0AAV5D5P8_ELECO|nr:hypothetical protein PR202_ga24031 [Eleusine coracana subsp. coracana]
MCAEKGPSLGFSDAGKVSVEAVHIKTAPLEATTVNVQLEVASSSATVGRAPLDLVVVLDISSSMCNGGKLDQFKSAIDFFVTKLSPMDRLSIVTFPNHANRVCPLIAMSEVGKFYVMGIVDGLMASGGANIKGGLETALEVLACRQYIVDRVAHILLLSDGHQDHGDAREVSIPCGIPIYTLAFGADANMELLRDLAQNGGTFNPVLDTGGVSMLFNVFDQLIAGLLNVAALDLYLILSIPSSPNDDLDMIVKVTSDNTHQETNRRHGTVTIKFGNLLVGQVRKVDVELLLFEADEGDYDYEADILDICVSYPNSKGIRQKFRAQTLHITRSDVKHHEGAADHTSSSSFPALEQELS